MRILQILSLIITVHCFFLFSSCDREIEYAHPIENLVADSIVAQAIKTSTALSLSAPNQKKAISILKKITFQKDFLLANDSLQALSYHWLGSFYHHLSEPDSAILYINTAIDMRKVGNYNSSELGLAKSYFNRFVLSDADSSDCRVSIDSCFYLTARNRNWCRYYCSLPRWADFKSYYPSGQWRHGIICFIDRNQ